MCLVVAQGAINLCLRRASLDFFPPFISVSFCFCCCVVCLVSLFWDSSRLQGVFFLLVLCAKEMLIIIIIIIILINKVSDQFYPKLPNEILLPRKSS